MGTGNRERGTGNRNNLGMPLYAREASRGFSDSRFPIPDSRFPIPDYRIGCFSAKSYSVSRRSL